MNLRDVTNQATNIYRALMRRSSPRPPVQCHGMHIVPLTWNDLRFVCDDSWYRHCYPMCPALLSRAGFKQIQRFSLGASSERQFWDIETDRTQGNKP